MRLFTEMQFRDAVAARMAAKENTLPQVEVLMKVTDILEDKFQTSVENIMRSPRNAIGALILYGMNIAFAIDDANCVEGDFHCLEHKAKNCECCGSASQVGKSETLNPNGPRYF